MKHVQARHASSLLALLLASACARTAAPPTLADTPAKVEARTVAPPVAQARAELPSAAALAEPADSSPFVDGARLGYSARLAVAGQSALLSTERLLLGIHDDRVVLEAELLEGLHPGTARFPRVVGNLPNAAWVVETTFAERTSRSMLSRWTGSSWVNADAALRGGNLVDALPWSGGRTLGLVYDEYGNQLAFVQLGGPRGVPLPRFERTAQNTYGCIHGIQPAAMSALASGEVYLAGTRCRASEAEGVEVDDLVVERWGAGQTRGKASVLPGFAKSDRASGEITSLLASSPSDALVAGVRTPLTPEGQDMTPSAYLAAFDGRSWRVLAAPPVERIDALQRSPNGALWAIAAGELWTSPSQSAPSWEAVTLPKGARELSEHAVTSLWVRGDGDVWITVGNDEATYLLRTQRGATPLSVPSDERVAEVSKALDPGAAYDCETPTLVLLTLSRQAPPDADFPGIRAAVRGHAELRDRAKFVELPFLNRRYLAVRGDMDTLRETESALSAAKIPGVVPELRCLEAEPTRTLALF